MAILLLISHLAILITLYWHIVAYNLSVPVSVSVSCFCVYRRWLGARGYGKEGHGQEHEIREWWSRGCCWWWGIPNTISMILSDMPSNRQYVLIMFSTIFTTTSSPSLLSPLLPQLLPFLSSSGRRSRRFSVHIPARHLWRYQAVFRSDDRRGRQRAAASRGSEERSRGGGQSETSTPHSKGYRTTATTDNRTMTLW